MRLQMFLVPELRPGDSGVFREDGKLRDPDALVATNLLELVLSAVDSLEPTFLLHACKVSDFGYANLLGYMAVHDIEVCLRCAGSHGRTKEAVSREYIKFAQGA